MQVDKNILFIYDLPKSVITSVNLSKRIQQVTDFELKEPPQIRRNPDRPFYSAMIKITDERFKEIAQKLRHFDLVVEDKNYPVRALPYDRELTGANRANIQKQNVFLKSINKEFTAGKLEQVLKERTGDEIKSLKISLNPDHTSRGYGFALFSTYEAAQTALGLQNVEGFDILAYNPKDKKDARKVFNNIYVKNFPVSWDEAKLRSIFEKYGPISSLITQTAKKDEQSPESKFAFICYSDSTNAEVGPASAARAVEQENDKVYDGQNIYVKEALKKAERDQEKRREQLRFKNSKKRCNLYVKNFPPNTTDLQLRELFQRFGEIESIKLFPKEGESLYAFVCYKSPDNAAVARQQLNMQTFNGKQLYVNHYELKEVRKIQQEEARDKADFQILQRSQPTQINTEFLNNPQVIQIIQMLIQQLGRNNNFQQRGNYQNRQNGGMRNQGGPRNYGAPNQMPGARPQPQQMALQGIAGGPMVGQPLMAPPQMMPQQMNMNIVPQQQQQIPQHIAEYLRIGSTLTSAVTPTNPNYKQQVGEFIYEYVETIVGEDKAPKITGMLIDLHFDEIKAYLVDFTRFNIKIKEAVQLLSQTPQ